MKRKVKAEYNSLESIKKFLTTKTDMECYICQDEWHSDGEITLTAGKQCLAIKKSGTAGAKIVLLDSNTIDIKPIAPSRFINTLTQRGILALIVHGVISGSQNKVAEEVEGYILEIQEN